MQLVSINTFDAWCWITVRSERAANAAPGQYLALRCAAAGGWDPLARQALPIAAADPRAGTAQLLVPEQHPAARFLSSLGAGAALDALGPLGRGWKLDGGVRALALLGTAAQAGALWSLAHAGLARGLAVSLLLGCDEHLAPPPPFLLPAAAEYDTAVGEDAAAMAVALLTPQLIGWADLLALAVPPSALGEARQRVHAARLQWRSDFAQALRLPPAACHNGACGVCAVALRRGTSLACVDGPVFDLKDLEAS